MSRALAFGLALSCALAGCTGDPLADALAQALARGDRLRDRISLVQAPRASANTQPLAPEGIRLFVAPGKLAVDAAPWLASWPAPERAGLRGSDALVPHLGGDDFRSIERTDAAGAPAHAIPWLTERIRGIDESLMRPSRQAVLQASTQGWGLGWSTNPSGRSHRDAAIALYVDEAASFEELALVLASVPRSEVAMVFAAAGAFTSVSIIRERAPFVNRPRCRSPVLELSPSDARLLRREHDPWRPVEKSEADADLRLVRSTSPDRELALTKDIDRWIRPHCRFAELRVARLVPWRRAAAMLQALSAAGFETLALALARESERAPANGADPAERPAADVPKDFSLSLQRHGCDAHHQVCPVYTLRMSGRGEIWLDGKLEPSALSVAEVHELARAVDDSRFFSLAAHYASEGVELPVVSITLRARGREKTVEHYGVESIWANEAPSALLDVEHLMDLLAQMPWREGLARESQDKGRK